MHKTETGQIWNSRRAAQISVTPRKREREGQLTKFYYDTEENSNKDCNLTVFK